MLKEATVLIVNGQTLLRATKNIYVERHDHPVLDVTRHIKDDMIFFIIMKYSEFIVSIK